MRWKPNSSPLAKIWWILLPIFVIIKVIGIIPKKVASKNFILLAPKPDAIRVWITKGIPGNNLKINKKLNSFFLKKFSNFDK